MAIKNPPFGRKIAYLYQELKYVKEDKKPAPNFCEKNCRGSIFLSSGDQCNVNNIANKLENI